MAPRDRMLWTLLLLLPTAAVAVDLLTLKQ